MLHIWNIRRSVLFITFEMNLCLFIIIVRSVRPWNVSRCLCCMKGDEQCSALPAVKRHP